ncbi:MAG: DUF3623 family protein, partial [Parvularcula sp.]|nr:DUF3623 family protein [Parvularcula sp.]
MTFALAIAFAILLWWSSTVAILRVVKHPYASAAKHGVTASVIAFAALLGVILLRGETSGWAAYAGFAMGVVSWGWHEVMLLLGLITGPRKTACPPRLALGPRFKVSLDAILH